MTLQPLGEAAFLLRGLDHGTAADWARLVRSWKFCGVTEVVPAYDSLGIYVDPEAFDAAKFFARFKKASPPADTEKKRHTIPVCYSMGEDLDDVCGQLSLTHQEFIASHTGRPYGCFAVGFCPGFAYLGPLDPLISGLPRRGSPRTRIEPGTVAVTGEQTGVYPLARPGGWNLVGRTPLELVDLKDGYFPIAAGDEVIFVSIDEEEFGYLRGERL
ncbi:MAG: allophanate hydrolase subunit 1 [Armatimonadetes bacterium]|nr:allophanate hydrolase subunit 1 [Armatimonadota bacterium]